MSCHNDESKAKIVKSTKIKLDFIAIYIDVDVVPKFNYFVNLVKSLIISFQLKDVNIFFISCVAISGHTKGVFSQYFRDRFVKVIAQIKEDNSHINVKTYFIYKPSLNIETGIFNLKEFTIIRTLIKTLEAKKKFFVNNKLSSAYMLISPEKAVRDSFSQQILDKAKLFNKKNYLLTIDDNSLIVCLLKSNSY